MYLVLRSLKNNKFFSIILCLAFYISFISLSIALIVKESKDALKHSNEIGYKITKNTISVPIKNQPELSTIIKLIENDFVQSDVYVDNMQIFTSTGSYTTVAVSLKDKYFWTPYIIKGNFFTKNDINSMVLGNETSDEYALNTVNYYTQIGTVGRKKSSTGIAIIYLPLQNLSEALKNSIITNGSINLTIINPTESMNTELASFTLDVKESLSENVKNFDQLPNNIKGFDKTENYYYKFIMIALVSGISVISYWVYKKKKEVSLKKAFGATNFRICIEFFIELFVLETISLIFSLLTISLLSERIHNLIFTYYTNPLTLYVLFYDIIFMVLLAIIIMVLPSKHIFKIFPVKDLNS